MKSRLTKYRAVKSNGYDSKKENKRANDLKFMEKANLISNLQEQVKFELVATFKDNQGQTEKSVKYVADFVYMKDSKKIVEDVKSSFTKKLPVYVIKRKLFKKLYPEYYFLET